MVMKGTTPRALGWKGGLTALALSGVLLPMSPTWAQKAAESTSTAAASASASADGETTTVIVGQTNDGSPDVVTFHAVAVNGDPATVEVVGKDANFRADTITVHAVADADDVKTIDVKGPNLAFAGAPITLRFDDEKDRKDKKDKDGDKKDGDKKDGDKKDGDKKDEPRVRGQFRYEFRGVPAEAREGMKKAAEDLKARIKELEDKKGDGPEAEVQIKALKAALEQIERMANSPDGAYSIEGRPRVPAEVRVFRREPKPDDPKAQEARKQVEELRKILAEKQKEVGEAAAKLAKAQAELAKLSNEFVTVQPNVNLQLKELRSLAAEARPRIAEGRALVLPGSDPRDKARIEALEKKLDQVLKQLDGLKKPESEDKR